MGRALESFGLQTAQGVIGAGMGLLLQGGQDRRQLRQERKLREQQMGFDKQMTDYNMAKQLEMWKATNYSAQIEELKKAGLNPALLYGMGGGGGTTADVHTGQVGGAQAPKGGGEAIAMAQTATQMGLLRSQQRLMEAQAQNVGADTRLKEAQRIKTEGVDSQLAGAQIESITQGVKNQKAQETLTNLESQLKELHLKLKQSTFHDEEQQIHFQMEKTYKELEILRNEKLLSDEQFKDKVALLRNQAIGQFLDNQLTKAQTDHERQVIENAKLAWIKIYEEIKSEMWQRYISGETLNVERRLADIKYKDQVNKEMEDEISNLLSSIIGGIIGGRLGTKNPPTPIRGLHDRR